TPFVLRWEIDNATSLTPGKVESAVFHWGGFEWKGSLRPREEDNDRFDYALSCEKKKWTDWKCKANVEFLVHRAASKGDYSKKALTTFDEHRNCSDFGYSNWSNLKNPNCSCILNNKITMEFSIGIISAVDGHKLIPIDLSNFCSPIEHNNVTLIIGDKKLRVSKDYLSVHSPLFAAMFFGDFTEKGKGEVKFKDVIYVEFLDLLQLIFHVQFSGIDSTLPHIL
ncbi:hypothetical protein PMAYCL1PPCAC_25580, partial [Pristionchus mayeri]